ncbi:glucosaminidase domain-containing protein [Phormidium sp. FACHB-1136]|uniref:glucosaminidase domain-containing protein n=1 Tax=Phormidium sp. FACHB-1136 TaxID=2692848 RepID=UPI001689753F|nr:glucosaminidase domain-containing protein [Phormidium sp. FACHB-1136]MBD2424512.1 glucosaminidase domain-containing protein [Phormidium sp. FACHB-1136]
MIFSWENYVQAVATIDKIPDPSRSLRVVQLAQGIVESARGTSHLFQEAGNPGGLKWRDNIDDKYTDKITHKIWLKTPTEPNGEHWCKWKTAEHAAIGYWRFVDRPNSPYKGWEGYSDNPEGYLQHIWDKGYAADPSYVSKIKSVFPEAKDLLAQYSKEAVLSSPKKIIALNDTWLKKEWNKQSSELDETEKAFVSKGKYYFIEDFSEYSLETELGGHALVNLSHDAGSWYIFLEHWQLPWTEAPEPTSQPQALLETLPQWDQVQWDKWSSPVSRYFTVGEVSAHSRERIVTDPTHKKNVIKLARRLDEVREWWGSALLVNSWYRPKDVERRVGGSGANHPFGYAVDLRPAQGSISDLESRFEQEWYNAGKWEGGFGRGARKGFIHLDLRTQRIWDY